MAMNVPHTSHTAGHDAAASHGSGAPSVQLCLKSAAAKRAFQGVLVALSLHTHHPALARPGHGPGGPTGAAGGGDGGGGGGSHQPVAAQPLATLGEGKDTVIITLASFAVTKLAYVRLTKLFRDAYYEAAGVDVRFRLTFAGSGVQARAIIDGLPADLAALALPLDLQKICDAGLIRPGWNKRYPNDAVVCETTVALVVRTGNPKGVHGWEDLTRDGIDVVLANPKTAGVAKWIFLALWGHRMKRGDKVATDYVTKVFDNVIVQPRDAREASDVFYRQKVGDVLLSYENEVIFTNKVYGSKALPYQVPEYNVRIECPLALIDAVVNTRAAIQRATADDFAKFLFTEEAQVEFGNVGFRPNPKISRKAADQFTDLPSARLWTVDSELGGWTAAQAKFFDAGGILDQIQMDVSRRKMEQRALAKA